MEVNNAMQCSPEQETHKLTWLDQTQDVWDVWRAWQTSRSCELCLPDWGWGCTAVRQPQTADRADTNTGTGLGLRHVNIRPTTCNPIKLPAVLLSIRVTLEEGCHCPATVLPLSCHCPVTLQTSSWPWGSYQFLPTALVTPTATCHHPDGNVLCFMETLIVTELHTTCQAAPTHLPIWQTSARQPLYTLRPWASGSKETNNKGFSILETHFF